MYLQKFSSFRRDVLTNQSLHYLLDLGAGVLDGAAVETAAYVLSNNSVNFCTFYDLEEARKDLLWLDYRDCSLNDDVLAAKPILRNIKNYDDGSNAPIKYTESEISKEVISASELFDAKPGLGTRDDFRFVRLWWEIPLQSNDDSEWVPVTFGGKSTHYYAEHKTVLNWKESGKELKEFIRKNYGSASRSIVNEGYYFKEGITYQYTGKTFRAHYMPEGMIVSMAGQGLYPSDKDDLFSLLGVLNTDFVTAELKKINPGRFFQASYVNSLCFDSGIKDMLPAVSECAKEAVITEYKLSRTYENSINFDPDCYFKSSEKYEKESRELRSKIAKSSSNINNLLRPFFDDLIPENVNNYDFPESIRNPLHFIFGVAVGRHDLSTIKAKHDDEQCGPTLPVLPSLEKWVDIHNRNSKVSIFTSDLESKNCIAKIMLDEVEKYELHEIFDIGSLQDVGTYLNRNFFNDHLNDYSENKRQAPIYWPLQSSAGSYTIWVYYHRLDEQTLYACMNDFVQPKHEKIKQDLNTLRGKSARNNREENELEKLSDLAAELQDFRDELLRLAKFWKPNLNDGVQVTAAPLWKLFQHKAWQKKLKETWGSLEKGDYDWAHLACSIWPDRVLRKCHQDRSLAIAHDVEDAFWHEVEVPVIRGKMATGKTKLEWQPKELSDAELNALIQARIKEMNA